MTNKQQHAPTINQQAYSRTHYELSFNKKEVEVYIGGWFLCSVDIKDISPEARDQLFAKAQG